MGHLGILGMISLSDFSGSESRQVLKPGAMLRSYTRSYQAWYAAACPAWFGAPFGVWLLAMLRNAPSRAGRIPQQTR